MRDASEIRTEKLYNEDAYAREFTAKVLSSRDGDVVLDRTLFFPEEGGQEPDTGILGGFRVRDVQIRDGEIHHFLEDAGALSSKEGGSDDPAAAPPEADRGFPAPGDTVAGTIDWERRFSNMQQHSGEHILSGIIHRMYGFENVGFHLSGSEVTLDFNGEIPLEGLDEAELEANRVITSDIESKVIMTTKEERESIAYRSKLDLPGEVRIVIFPGTDACACCAPHVKRTGEIGVLKVLGAIRWKGGTRVSILCGGRAVRFLAGQYRILTRTANELTTSAEEVFPQILRMKEEIRELRSSKKELETRLLEYMAAEIPPDRADAVIFTGESDPKAVRELINREAAARSGCAAVFTGNDKDGYSFMIGSANSDATLWGNLLKERFGARGGGKPAMVQGFVSAAEEEIRKLFD